jgi:hypothetical protein
MQFLNLPQLVEVYLKNLEEYMYMCDFWSGKKDYVYLCFMLYWQWYGRLPTIVIE